MFLNCPSFPHMRVCTALDWVLLPEVGFHGTGALTVGFGRQLGKKCEIKNAPPRNRGFAFQHPATSSIAKCHRPNYFTFLDGLGCTCGTHSSYLCRQSASLKSGIQGHHWVMIHELNVLLVWVEQVILLSVLSQQDMEDSIWPEQCKTNLPVTALIFQGCRNAARDEKQVCYPATRDLVIFCQRFAAKDSW